MCKLIVLNQKTFGRISWTVDKVFMLGGAAPVKLARPEKAGGGGSGLPLQIFYQEDRVITDGTPPRRVSFRANFHVFRGRKDAPESTTTAQVTLRLTGDKGHPWEMAVIGGFLYGRSGLMVPWVPFRPGATVRLIPVGANPRQPAWDEFKPTPGFLVEGFCDWPLLAIWAWQQWASYWHRKVWYSVPRAH